LFHKPTMNPPKRFVVQDSWNEEEDQELHHHIGTIQGITVDRLSAAEILKLQPRLDTMIFCDSNLVQKLLGAHQSFVIDTYPRELEPLYKRSIRTLRLDQAQPELPYFVKLVGNNKDFMARVVRTKEEAVVCAAQVGDQLAYVCDTREFVSEHRIFLSPGGTVWGIQEYSEYMVGHRLRGGCKCAAVFSRGGDQENMHMILCLQLWMSVLHRKMSGASWSTTLRLH